MCKLLAIFAGKTNYMTELDKYRDNIDNIDKKLIDLLASRFSFSIRIGELKEKKGIPILQSTRWDDILSSRQEYAIKAGLSEVFTRDFLQLVHNESIRIQQEVTARKRPGKE
jgi:chorismate mutase